MQFGVARVVLLLSGMRSNSCREHVVEVLRGVDGVTDVNVSLIRARAVVLCERATVVEELIRTVSEAGYQAALDE